MKDLKSVAVMDCETRMVTEFLRMKAILDKKDVECESVLFDSLLKLQGMVASVKILEETGIGKSVSVLQNHVSKDIRQNARTIIKSWRGVIDEWINAIFVVQEEEVGEKKYVPMSKQQRPLLIRIKVKKVETDSGKESVVKVAVTPEQKVQNSNGVDEGLRIKDVLESQSDSVVSEDMAGIGKTVRILQKHESKEVGKTAGTLVKEWIKKDDSSVIKPTSSQGIKPMRLNIERKIQVISKKGKSGSGIEDRLDEIKRKLKHNYMEAENLKKKRRIQVIDLHELTKQGLLPQKSGLTKASTNKQLRRW